MLTARTNRPAVSVRCGTEVDRARHGGDPRPRGVERGVSLSLRTGRTSCILGNPRFDVDPGIVGVSLSANRRAKAVPLGRCTGSPGKRYVGMMSVYIICIHRLTVHRCTTAAHRGTAGPCARKLAIYAIIRASTVAINSALQRSSSPPPISHRIAACRFCLGRLVSLDGRLALGVVGVWFRACG